MCAILGQYAAHSKERLCSYLATAVELLNPLGFIINTKKSIFIPSKVIEFLGFVLDHIVPKPQAPPDPQVNHTGSGGDGSLNKATSVTVINSSSPPSSTSTTMYYR